MKKITDFIVEKRYYILISFIILSLVSLYIGTKVEINDDISKYLPENSETKIGMNIMENEFKELKQSDLFIMFEDLDNDEKESIKNELEATYNVNSVSYDSSDKYNKDNYTLYILNVDDYKDSDNAKELYNNIKSKYKNKKISLGGSIDKANKPIVKTWILISAVVFAMIILIIMCESYIEPFLFLFVIGLAIFLNNGTNIIFKNVSNITNAISAILQLALSMDYSIMLMNRYSQEKSKTKDNIKAMKEALYNASKSITGSSITTIVGLLALIFMSFTIGKDLGFVLAKGVFFSLVSIFLCLPALILLFDKAIEKTKKKSLAIKINKLGNLSYKTRYIALSLFIMLFVLSFLLKGNLNYLYTGAEQDTIASHFESNNQMAIIYNNKYQDEITSYCQSLNTEKIDNILCYGNTINEPLKYDELNNKLEDLGNDTKIDEYLIKIVYYYYNNNDINNKMTFNEFISFIENTIYNNEKINAKIDLKMKMSIIKLKSFVNKDSIEKKRNINEISSLLDIDKEKVKTLFILEHKNNVNIKMTLKEFIDFLNKDVIPNKEYNSYFDKDTINNINALKIFTDKDLISTQINAKDLSSLFELDEETTNKLLMLYYTNKDSGFKTTVTNFFKGIDLSRNYLINEDISSLEPLIKIAKNDNNINNTCLTKDYLKLYFAGNESLVDMVYMYSGFPDSYAISPNNFLNIVITNFNNQIPVDSLNKLKLLQLIMNDNNIEYSYSEMATILGIDNKTILKLYAIIGSAYNYEYKISPFEFVTYILNKQSNQLLSNIPLSSIKKLDLLNNVMNGVLNNKAYSYKEIESLLNISNEKASLLYSLYDLSYNNNYKISLNNFINFILNDVITDSKYKNNFDDKSINKLQTINKVMNGSLNDTKYSNKELFDIIHSLSESIESKTIDLIYIYNGSINNYNDEYSITLENFINFLNNNIVKNEIFNDYIDSTMKENIINAKYDIIDAKEILVGKNFSRVVINTTYDKEGKETFEFIQNIKDDLKSKDKEMYLIGDSPMAYDLDGTFSRELNFITILTMIAIFIVVALTFKSLIIPLILVLIIECSVFITMSIISFSGTGMYFIAIIIVQSILMGATIDYAIVFTSYYKENRLKNNIITSITNSYNNSIHTILTSASILIIVTFIVGLFAEAIAAKICMTISKGTLCSSILILLLLPGMLAVADKLIVNNKKKHKKIKN